MTRRLSLLLATLLLTLPLSGCLVAGYSSGGGLWVWPGSLLVTLLLILFFFLSRRR
ncbi:MAG: hypothetical protein M3O02_03985 [Acidobacteriota bacterium]|nr:hypothetical protein [Acidobacteriota bacterium]